ncbi:FAD-dependent oxidoreductase [Polynucleobacter necessarius]|uniref:FAD-dependent oxidoreductase n=1 Tax=Polynucleobacter necessarius TaxID=576610 RepID=UPI0039E277C4
MASSKPSQNTVKPELPVLIIGAGFAGFTVALHMAKSQPVILMAKRGLGEAATAWAQGGIVGVVDQEHE